MSFFHYYLHHIPSLLTQARHTLTWYFLTHYGVKRHARQLFLPWRRLYLSENEKGYYSAWHITTFNLISRLLGAMVRSVIIITGLTLAAAAAFSALMLTLLWFILFPIALLSYAISSKHHSHLLPSDLTQPEALIKFLQSQPCIQEVFARADATPEQVNQFFDCLRQHPNPVVPLDQHEALLAHRFAAEAALALLECLLTNAVCQDALTTQPLDIDLLQQSLSWVKDRVIRFDRRYHWYEKEAWERSPVIGRDWAYGFTPTLDKFARNLNEVVEKKTQVETRPSELKHMHEVFANQQNPAILLVGDPGVGKKTLCFSLAQSIVDRRVPTQLADHRVMLLDMDAVIAAAHQPAEQIWLLTSIFAEASTAGNCIVIIEDLDRFVGNQFAEADFSTLLSKVGKEFRLKIIGLVTTSGFRTTITQNALVMSGFDIRHLKALTPEETLEVLQYVAYRYETTGLLITLPALQEIVKQSRRLMDHIPNPEKSLTLLDMVLAGLSVNHPRLTKHDVLAILSHKVGIPLGGVTDQDRVTLQNLEGELSKRVIGQTRAIKALASAVKRAALQLHAGDKPKGSFLFLGPTGVGKTETAKALADIYFGSRERMIRIDFGEYSSAASLPNLIGAAVGQSDHQAGGLLTEAIRQNPYSVVLFDELEKAHPSILTALLTVFDEGYLTDARGQQISFRHSFIIATSNAASQLLYAHSHQRSGQENADEELDEAEYTQLHEQVVDNLITSQAFAPEFLNRFDGLILFSPLTRSQLEKIVDLKLRGIQQQLLQEQQIRVELSPAKRERILQLAYSPTFGARNLERVLTSEVIDACADKLLEAAIEPGSVVVLE